MWDKGQLLPKQKYVFPERNLILDFGQGTYKMKLLKIKTIETLEIYKTHELIVNLNPPPKKERQISKRTHWKPSKITSALLNSENYKLKRKNTHACLLVQTLLWIIK